MFGFCNADDGALALNAPRRHESPDPGPRWCEAQAELVTADGPPRLEGYLLAVWLPAVSLVVGDLDVAPAVE